VTPANDEYPEGETGDDVTVTISIDAQTPLTTAKIVTVDDTPPTVEHHWTHGTYVVPRSNAIEWEATDSGVVQVPSGSGLADGDPMYSTSFRWVRASRYMTTQNDASLPDDDGTKTFPLTLNSGFTTYCMSVFAEDKVGNLGLSGVVSSGNDYLGNECTVIAGDDYQLAPAAGFTRSTGTNYSFGTVTYATRTGATLTVPGTTAKTIVVKGRTCPTCGGYEVWLGTRRLGSVSLASTSGFKTTFFNAPSETTGNLVLKSTSAKWTGIDLVWATGPCLGLAKNCFSLATGSQTAAANKSNVSAQDTRTALVAPKAGQVGLAERFAKIEQRRKAAQR
jgi:hypothetical protein